MLNWFRYEVNNKGAFHRKETQEKKRTNITSSIRTYLEHVLIVFFLAFALAFFGSIEELMHIHMEGKCDSKGSCFESLDSEYIWIFVSYALLESSLVALLAIEFTTAFFVRHHEKSESLVASLIIAGTLDIAAFVLIKTVIAQPSIPLTDSGAGLGYIADYEIAILLAVLMVLSFISSFGAINQAQIFVNDALDDHRNFLRISERLVTLSDGVYINDGIRESNEHKKKSNEVKEKGKLGKKGMDDEVWGMEYISSNRARNTINVIIELSKPERYGGVDSEGISDSDEKVD